MAAIFLSYAREDRRFAETLAQVLESASHSVWWDGRIGGGEEFSAEIETELDKSDVVVVAWSKESVKSRWVRDEAAVGGDTDRLVPVSIDGSLPAMGFRQFHTLDLTGWKGGKRDARTAELLQSVERRLKRKVAAPVPVTRPARGFRISGVNRIWAVAAIAVVLVAVAAYLFVSRKDNAPTSAPSVALLPFTADSSDADARKLALATRETVAHTLSQGAFAVSAIDALPQNGRPPADFLISGQVTTTPDKIVTTVRMEETEHRVVVFSHQFEAGRDKAWDLPEQVGAQVASQLSWTAPMIALERRHPSDPAIVAALLQSSTAGLEGAQALQDFETARRLAAKAPDSPLAQNLLAFNTAFAVYLLPREQRAEAIAAARRAVDRTTKLAPEFGGGYIPWCLLHSDMRMAECEDRLRTAMRRDPDDPFVNWFLSRLLNNVGRNAEAAGLARLSLAHDPYMPYKIAQMLRMLEITGQTREAAELFQKSTRWWPGNGEIAWYRVSGMIQRGDFKAAQRFEDVAGGGSRSTPAALAIAHGSIVLVRSACSTAEDADSVLCMLALARLGDGDAAFRSADQLYPNRRGRNTAEENRLWIENPPGFPLAFLTSPVAAPMRRDPRYLQLAERTGLLEYWRSGRPPDFCRKHPEAICVRLQKRD
ncbi:MAG: TIR domain-containing protein [Sphingomicrobium sp.]